MKILDENNNEIQNPDYDKGYLTNETIVIAHHEAVEAKPGKSHIEVIKEYDNGGKDVVTVWDEEPVEAKDAWDETEKIQRYHAYTDEQLAERKKEKEESANRQKKLDSLYTADMTFKDVVDAVAGLLYGGAES
jgi:hypothetical protein